MHITVRLIGGRWKIDYLNLAAASPLSPLLETATIATITTTTMIAPKPGAMRRCSIWQVDLAGPFDRAGVVGVLAEQIAGPRRLDVLRGIRLSALPAALEPELVLRTDAAGDRDRALGHLEDLLRQLGASDWAFRRGGL